MPVFKTLMKDVSLFGIPNTILLLIYQSCKIKYVLIALLKDISDDYSVTDSM